MGLNTDDMIWTYLKYFKTPRSHQPWSTCCPSICSFWSRCLSAHEFCQALLGRVLKIPAPERTTSSIWEEEKSWVRRTLRALASSLCQFYRLMMLYISWCRRFCWKDRAALRLQWKICCNHLQTIKVFQSAMRVSSECPFNQSNECLFGLKKYLGYSGSKKINNRGIRIG